MCFYFAAQGLPLHGQSHKSGLKIVVLEGEDGVNIIRQNTAVKPVVEVRDKNDLPVADALVVFLLPREGAGGTFSNGLKEYSILTDANGRAAVEGLRLDGAGAFKMEVRASFQGQTATKTISQTNFTTAADAAQAGKQPSNSAQNSANSNSGNSNSTAPDSGSANVPGRSAPTVPTGGGMSGVATAGLVGGLGALGATAAYKSHDQNTAKNCGAQWNQVISDLNSEQQICTNRSSTFSQCQASAQRGLNDLGQFCSCQGGGDKVPAEYRTDYQNLVQELRSLARQLGLTMPASCGF